MNLSKFDFGILVTMVMIVVFMSFVFPTLGLTGSKTTESDIPRFNITTNKFDFATEFPETPGTPSQGTLHYDESELANGNNDIFLDGDTTNGYEMLILEISGSPQWHFNEYSSSSVVGGDEYTFSGLGDTITHQNNSYIVYANVTQFGSATNFSIYWEIEQQPSDTSFISRIPIIGGLFSAGQALASIVAYIASLIFYGLTLFSQFTLNIISVIFDSAVYFVTLLHFILSTYFNIVSGAPSGYISVLVLFPGIIIFIEFSKITIILVDVIR